MTSFAFKYSVFLPFLLSKKELKGLKVSNFLVIKFHVNVSVLFSIVSFTVVLESSIDQQTKSRNKNDI